MPISPKAEHTNDPQPIHILHLEDTELDIELVSQTLRRAGIDCEITVVQTRDDFVSRLFDEKWDVILADYSLPAFDGLEALTIAAKISADTPFIFVTGTLGEDIVVESLKSGATDYVLKTSLRRLGSSVRRALSERAERRRREEAEAELGKSEERIRFQAYHDTLTGTLNRASFEERLAETLCDAIRRNEYVALLYIDLDNFKDVNDSLGHPTGDIVLQQIAERLKKCSRRHDTVARLGGDEFVFVVNSIKDSSDAVIAANRIKTAVAEELVANGSVLFMTCSIGISVFPMDGADAATLVKNADLALFSAKNDGRNAYRFFTQDMNDRAMERFTMEAALRRVIEKKELFLEYQPQLEFSTGRILGAEALLRWRHPDLGLIPPSKFIPMAEKIGEIIRIGEWVLRTACTQAKQWQEEGLPPVVIAVNVSASQLCEGSLPATVERILNDTGLAAQYLELEITESQLIASDERTSTQIVRLREIGLSLALDDFGTGYSNFSYLRRFRFDKLKIDGSFVRTLHGDPTDIQIAASIISVGRILGMEVIAECVETEEQVELLSSLGCDQFQGFYFSRPVTAAAFADQVRSKQSSGQSLVRSFS
jgi:diguanylate cyclase (GGDEF)-like protein